MRTTYVRGLEAGRHYPLTFLRVYNSRYNKGALGAGFTHSYDYSLINDRGIIRVTILAARSRYSLRSVAAAMILWQTAALFWKMKQTAATADARGRRSFIFSNDGKTGKLQTVYNPDGTQVAQLTYNGDELIEIDGIAGSYTLAWSNGHISSVTDNAGRTVSYEHDNDLLTGVTNADGDTLHYTYDGNGYLNSAYRL